MLENIRLVFSIIKLAAIKVDSAYSQADIVIVEGVFLLDPSVVNLLDIKIYIDADADLCLTRCMRRDPHAVNNLLINYEQLLKPIHLKLFSSTKEKADIIVHNQRQVFDINLIPVLDCVSQIKQMPFLHRQSPHIVSPTFDASQALDSKAQGTLYVVSGPSGVGKSTILKRFLEAHPIEKIVPYTTRARREAEIDGVDYRFIGQDEFMKLFSSVPFLQHIEGFGNHYGVPAPDVLQKLAKGVSLIIDLTPDALAQVRRTVRNVRYVFICPPAMTTITERLTKRDKSGPDTQKRYEFSLGMLETASYQGYDYLIINDNLGEAVNALAAIVSADNSTLKAQQSQNADFFKRVRVYRTLTKLKEQVLPSLDVDKCEMRSLSSLTNASYKITQGEKIYFLRVLRPANQDYRIAMLQEHSNLQKVSELKLYPPVTYYDLESGSYLAPFLSDHQVLSPTKICSEQVFKTVIKTVYKLHQMSDFKNDNNRYAHGENVLLKLKSKGVVLPTDIESIAVICHRVFDLLNKSCLKKVPCNNDLSPYNMLYNEKDGSLVIADWELSGNSDLFSDLAKLSVEVGFNEEQDREMLEAYNPELVTKESLSKLKVYKLVIEFHLALWAKWQFAIGNDATSNKQFEKMFLVRLDNCRKYVSSNEYWQSVELVRCSVYSSHPALAPTRFNIPISESTSPVEIVQHDATASSSVMRLNNRVLSDVSKSAVERTLVILKPDIVSQNKIGNVIAKMEKEGFSLVAQKFKMLTLEEVEKLYPKVAVEAHRYDLLDLMTAGPVVILVLEGVKAIASLVQLKGSSNSKATNEDTLRKLFGTDPKWNAVHCSDDIDSANREIALFFSPNEIYTRSFTCTSYANHLEAKEVKLTQQNRSDNCSLVSAFAANSANAGLIFNGLFSQNPIVVLQLETIQQSRVKGIGKTTELVP